MLSVRTDRSLFISRLTFTLAGPVVSVLLSVITGALIFSMLNIPVTEALFYFYLDPVRDLYGLGELILKVTPIAICALGLLLCFKAGIWNIGAEGQYLLGCIVGSWMALSLDAWQTPFALWLSLFAGCVGGALWAGVPAILKVKFGASEILVTIMMNYIAIHLLMFVVNGPLKDPSGFSFPESALFPEHTLLPQFFESSRINVSILFPVVMAGIITWFLHKTRQGFELTIMGKSRKAARFAGIQTNHLIIVVMLICGACAGLAGASEVTGPVGQLLPQLAVGYGYTAIICVYLGRMNPFGILFASLLLGVTYVGAESVQMHYETPAAISLTFQGLILFFLLSVDYFVLKLMPKVGDTE